ncbi:hypothetical protein PQU94_11080 [Asticcacaulis sp. DXS10W]|uniref:Uncharacterized protein n=1 Tax=Asticcacaulis currens TaxID=2984210 RepID=A0ABT5IF82_9CAUL|nr:hypothetical protein [Asticcacaulis currens]MDC7694823.1 hypothetical protein [Asticcacaulis currens]
MLIEGVLEEFRALAAKNSQSMREAYFDQLFHLMGGAIDALIKQGLLSEIDKDAARASVLNDLREAGVSADIYEYRCRIHFALAKIAADRLSDEHINEIEDNPNIPKNNIINKSINTLSLGSEFIYYIQKLSTENHFSDHFFEMLFISTSMSHAGEVLKLDEAGYLDISRLLSSHNGKKGGDKTGKGKSDQAASVLAKMLKYYGPLLSDDPTPRSISDIADFIIGNWPAQGFKGVNDRQSTAYNRDYLVKVLIPDLKKQGLKWTPARPGRKPK